MSYVAKNNAYSTLAAGITNVATSLTVQAGKGALFAVSSPEYTYATLEDTSGNIEIIKITARATDTLTITRAQDGTSARAWNSGDVIECRPCAAAMNDYAVAPQINTSSATAIADADELGFVDASASNALAKITWANIKATLKTYFDTLYGLLEAARSDIASAATLNLNSTTTHSLRVTGTTTTTAMTLADGAYRKLVAAAAWPITHGANLVVQGAADYTCEAGDIVHAFGEPAGVVRLMISRANGTAVVGGATGAFALSGDISPAQITADQNNYSPTGLAGASVLRLNSDAARNITGLDGGADGRLLAVHNVGGFAITLKDESASSTAANRFALTADLALAADAVVLLQYDSTSGRWRAASGSNVAADYVMIREEQASGTNGGTFTSGAWQKRTLNTEVSDAGGHASIASSVITLAAGTYRFRARAPAYAVAAHQVRLANTSDSIYFYGSSCLAPVGASHQGDSVVSGRFSIAASKNFELQHRCGTTSSTYGLGNATSFGGVEVYAEIEFWKDA